MNKACDNCKHTRYQPDGTMPICDYKNHRITSLTNCCSYWEGYEIQKMPGAGDQTIKYDAGKDDYMLIPPEWHKWLMQVFAVGFKRHGEDNWRKVEVRRWEAALLRHLQAYREGEHINTEDDNVFHLAQISWNALAILSKIENETI